MLGHLINKVLACRASMISRSASTSLLTVKTGLTAIGLIVDSNIPSDNIRWMSETYSTRSPLTRARCNIFDDDVLVLDDDDDDNTDDGVGVGLKRADNNTRCGSA